MSEQNNTNEAQNVSQQNGAEEEEEDDGFDPSTFIVYIPIDPSKQKRVILPPPDSDEETPNSDENKLIDMKIDPTDPGASDANEEMTFIGPKPRSEAEIKEENEMKIKEIISEIKYSEDIRGRTLRSVKNRGQSSQRRSTKPVRHPQELVEPDYFSNDKDNKFIRDLWDKNYGKHQNIDRNEMKISSLAKSQTNYKSRKKIGEEQKKLMKLNQTRMRCRARNVWAKDMLDWEDESQK